jgi:hypothetical protein
MKTAIALALLLAIAPTATLSAAPTAKASGIRVIRETHGEGFKGLTPFNSQKKGTTLALLLQTSTGAIIKVDTRESTLESFTDDKGTDLLIEKKGFNKDGFGHFARISEDGKGALIDIESGGLPAAGATKVTAKGSLLIQTASTKKAFKSAPIALIAGTELTIGEIALKVEKVGKPSFGDDALELELETTNKAIERVADVKFFDAAGKELESNSSGSSSMGFGKKYTYGRSYNFKKAVTGKVVVQFEMWTDFEETQVPITVTMGIGG